MKNYSLVRRGSNGRISILFESTEKDAILLHFIHALEFERQCGFQIHKLVLSELNSYFLYGNSLFTAKIFIL